MHPGRTLTNEGVKQVTAVVQSRKALSYSYTIQPICRIDGKLHYKLFVCLQESAGHFPTRDAFKVLEADNLYVTCSKSGKLTKKLLLDFFKDVFHPFVSSD